MIIVSYLSLLLLYEAALLNELDLYLLVAALKGPNEYRLSVIECVAAARGNGLSGRVDDNKGFLESVVSAIHCVQLRYAAGKKYDI